ncbi:MAG: UbiX family flavin prenyltransferase [Planctomycetota bacterium]
MKRIALGITGASGAILARELTRALLAAGCEVHLTASRAGRIVIAEELGPPVGGAHGVIPGLTHERLREWGEKDFSAPFASGSARFAGMAIVPCSMSTVGAIASGISDNLLRRGAEVMLKERRPLVIAPREAPLSTIHLRNLLTAAEAGAIVIPPVLTFYQKPGDSVLDQVRFVLARVLDHLGVANELAPRWGETAAGNPPS